MFFFVLKESWWLENFGMFCGFVSIVVRICCLLVGVRLGVYLLDDNVLFLLVKL